ncbi:hypothetical protein FDP41_006051 [Naegleria fowleri]|uniref:Transmembrane protein n=2 Tax=Naegleria fowleri TaxID=5763 RepID=A0A6A5BJE4_NAEFO|nr:uncharacterized protein FDP41_006051 [Naegleria fowleri]KAF0974946.1 hypothetical protein FDP41_006051 [Naegleria fowleri]
MPRAFIYPILLVCLIFYIPTVFMSPTYSYLTNFNVNQKIQEIVQKTIRDTPIIELHVSCYHYETRTQTTTDANGRLKTESRSVRVTTHTDSKQMPFEFHRDFSPPFAIKQTAKTFIKLDMDQKVFVTNEESKKILDEERVAIYVSNRNRDTHMDYSEFWGTENFESSLLTHNPNSRVPKIATPFWYQFFCLFFLGWAYTFWFNNICDTQEYTFIKELSYHPFNDEQVDNNVDPSMYMGGAYGFQFRGGSGAFCRTFNMSDQLNEFPTNMFSSPPPVLSYRPQQPQQQPFGQSSFSPYSQQTSTAQPYHNNYYYTNNNNNTTPNQNLFLTSNQSRTSLNLPSHVADVSFHHGYDTEPLMQTYTPHSSARGYVPPQL